MNDTQMELTLRNFGVIYPLGGTPCRKCHKRFDEHEYLRENHGFDSNVCPEDELPLPLATSEKGESNALV